MKVMQVCNQFFFLPCNREKKFKSCVRILGNWMLQIAMLSTAVKFGAHSVRKLLGFLKYEAITLQSISFCHAMKKNFLRAAHTFGNWMLQHRCRIWIAQHWCKILGGLGAQNSGFSKKKVICFFIADPPWYPPRKNFYDPPLDPKVYDPPLELGPLHTYVLGSHSLTFKILFYSVSCQKQVFCAFRFWDIFNVDLKIFASIDFLKVDCIQSTCY